MSDLPSNWAWSTIGAVTDYIQRGKSPKYADQSSLPVINQKCIRWNELQLQHLKYVHPDQIEVWDEPRHIRPGDILWNSTGTGTVGRAYLVKHADCTPPKVVDSHVTIVRAATGINPRYLFNWIKGPAVQNKIEEMCDGTTNQIELSRTAIAATVIPVAPEDEQTRIADQLDKLLARIQSCNDRLDAIPALLKRFRQAVLSAATSGALTEDWREENESSAWIPSELAACGAVSGGLTKNAKRQTLTLIKPYLRVANVYANRLELSDVSEIGLTQSEYQKTKLRSGDLLIVEGNGSLDQLGRVALWSDELGDCVHQNHLIRWRTSGPLPKFVLYWLLSPRGRADLTNLASTTTGLHTLSISKVGAVPIDLPPMEEQAEIVRRVEALFKLADRIEVRYIAARTQAQRLSPLLLAKAFRGELVPQDPNDEPASALLERISAERQKATAQLRPRQSAAGRKTETNKVIQS